MSVLIKSIARNAIGLGLFAMVTAGLIAVTQQLTADDIRAQRQQAQAGALLEVIPAEHHDNELLDDPFTVAAADALGLTTSATGYRARQGDEIVAVILPVVAPDGYAGPIRLIVGVGRDGELLGVRVLEHKETPGLGDQIEARKSDWILGFEGRSLGEPPAEAWRVQKKGGHFDQFTGATITPDAVVTAVKDALQYFETHRRQLLSEQATISGASETGATDER